jgi:hypothetical protein
MVVVSNPFCPVSFGFLGFLNGVLSRRSFLYNDNEGPRAKNVSEEEEDLLAVGEDDCDEISEDRISRFLENQKSQYYRSIGLAPPKQLRTIETSTTPGASIIEFSSSRETSYLDESEESALIASDSSTPAPESSSFTPQTFRMDDSDQDPPRENMNNNCDSSLVDEKPRIVEQKVDLASLTSLATNLLESEEPFVNAEGLQESTPEQTGSMTAHIVKDAEEDICSVLSPECDIDAYLSPNDEDTTPEEH